MLISSPTRPILHSANVTFSTIDAGTNAPRICKPRLMQRSDFPGCLPARRGGEGEGDERASRYIAGLGSSGSSAPPRCVTYFTSARPA